MLMLFLKEVVSFLKLATSITLVLKVSQGLKFTSPIDKKIKNAKGPIKRRERMIVFFIIIIVWVLKKVDKSTFCIVVTHDVVN